jgi:hypothetical protein
VSFTPQPFYPQGKSHWYPLDRRLGGPESRSGRGGEEINSHPLSGLEPPIIQPVSERYTTEITRLHRFCTVSNPVPSGPVFKRYSAFWLLEKYLDAFRWLPCYYS